MKCVHCDSKRAVFVNSTKTLVYCLDCGGSFCVEYVEQVPHQH